MHIAYLSGKNTVAILGSTRSDWVNPKMAHTFFFTSDDIECGNCMLEVCKFKTNFCMMRISSEQVLKRVLKFLN
jgi:heptosyltransferase-2